MKRTVRIRMSSDAGFTERLLVAAPALTPVFEEHRLENGEVLPHVFMGAVTRRLLENSEQFPVADFLDFFEKELASGDAQAAELIALGFCENLQGEERALIVLRPMMGPRLFATLKQVLGA